MTHTEQLFPSQHVYVLGRHGNCPPVENSYGSRETGTGGLLIARISPYKTRQAKTSAVVQTRNRQCVRRYTSYLTRWAATPLGHLWTVRSGCVGLRG
jgi:hypothetical protein